MDVIEQAVQAPELTQLQAELPAEVRLARAAAAGDERSLVSLMRANNRRLYRTARSILRDDSEAEDVVQDTYLKAIPAMKEFRGEAKLSTWLVRIAVNEAVLKLRQRERRPQSADNITDLEDRLAERALAETPEDLALRGETRRLIEQKIDRLPAAFRTVFVLRALEELSVEEVSACLRIPPATVRTRFLRARRLLQAALTREMKRASDQAFSFDGERCDRIVREVLGSLRSEPPCSSTPMQSQGETP